MAVFDSYFNVVGYGVLNVLTIEDYNIDSNTKLLKLNGIYVKTNQAFADIIIHPFDIIWIAQKPPEEGFLADWLASWLGGSP